MPYRSEYRPGFRLLRAKTVSAASETVASGQNVTKQYIAFANAS
jgi:hypothetical protein